MITLLSQPHLNIQRCTTVNPASLLPTPSEGIPHNCVGETDERVAAREGLKDEPFANSEITMFVDGSCTKRLDGTNAAGFAVVTATQVLQLPSNMSAQAAEITAVTEACKIAEGKTATIYTL